MNRLKALSIDGVCSKTSLSKTRIYAMIKDGEFPPGFLITKRRRAWEETDIDIWLADKIQQNSAA